jgi:hypothetical protein
VRINNIGTPVVTVPEQGPQVDAVRATGRIGQQTSGGAPVLAPTPAPVAPTAAAEPAPAAAASERRRGARRGGDRRAQQVPVLIDTRVSQRRRKRRRTQDAPPDGVDVDA